MKKINKDDNQITFIIVVGIIILCVFSFICASSLLPINNESDSYFVKLEDDMNAKIESLDIENNKLKITMSGDTVSYCVKSTKSNPSANSLCWKKVDNNVATISIYQYKKYYVWIKDANGNISIPMSINTKSDN